MHTTVSQQHQLQLDSDSSTEANVLAVQALELAAELRTRACVSDSVNRLQKQPLVAVTEAITTTTARTSTTSTANATTTAARTESEGATVKGDAPNGKSLLGQPLFLQLHPQLQQLLQQKQQTGVQAARVRHSVVLISQLQAQQESATTSTAATTAAVSYSTRLHSGSAASSGAYDNGSAVVRGSCSSSTAAPRLSTERKLTVNSSSSTSNSTSSTITAAAAITATTAITAAAAATDTTSDMSTAVPLIVSSSIATPRVSGMYTHTVNTNSSSSSSFDSKHAVVDTAAAAADADKAIAAVGDSSSLVTPRVSTLHKPLDSTGSSSTATDNTTTGGTAVAAIVSSSSSDKGSTLSPQRPLRFRPSFGSHRSLSPGLQPQSVELVLAEQELSSATNDTQPTVGAARDSSSSSSTSTATAAVKLSTAAFADIWPAVKRLTVRSVDSTDGTNSGTVAAAAAAAAAAAVAAAAAISGSSSSTAVPLRASATGLTSRRTVFCADNGILDGRCSLAAVSDALIFACSTAAMAGSSTSDSTYAINSVVQSQKESAVRNAAIVESEHTMLFDNKGAVDTAIALSSQQIGAVVASSADLMTDALLDKLQAMSSKGNSSGSSGAKTTSGSGGGTGSGSSGRKILKPVTVVTAGRRKAPPALFKVLETTANNQ
jgi:hypothetical protein